VLTRFLLIVFSFSIFFSSTGLLIQKHFCQNELQSISLFLNAKSCHSDSSHQCNFTKKSCCQIITSKEKDNCCHNQSEYVKLELDQYLFKYYLKNKSTDFVGLLKYFNQQSFYFFIKKEVKFFNYKPPLIKFNLLSLFQVFLC
jgi:hypothetical protein